ncbi:Suppressor of Sensor Kinase (SLN1) [Blastocladiella emersonii ATCC 22665]|nr:Suppressor of Sensor Kinase (SLN1) [Blastocladiella emersonii ATCC 22665]
MGSSLPSNPPPPKRRVPPTLADAPMRRAPAPDASSAVANGPSSSAAAHTTLPTPTSPTFSGPTTDNFIPLASPPLTPRAHHHSSAAAAAASAASAVPQTPAHALYPSLVNPNQQAAVADSPVFPFPSPPPASSTARRSAAVSAHHGGPTATGVPSDGADGGAEPDPLLHRYEWLSMLESVLTGEILRLETQRLFSQSSWTEPDKKYELWLALRAVHHGHSVLEERHLVDTRRTDIDAGLLLVLDFMADPRDSVSDTRAKVAEQLDRVQEFRDLYPTDRAFRADKPLYMAPRFQAKVEVMQTWLNLTEELHQTMNIFARWTGGALPVLSAHSPAIAAAAAAGIANGNGNGNGNNNGDPSSPSPTPAPGAARDTPLTAEESAAYNESWIHTSNNILEMLFRERDPQSPLERRFVSDLPRYLRRLKSTVLQFTDQFAAYNLPIDFTFISALGQLSLELVQEIHRIRLSYSSRIKELTITAVDQLLKDFKSTLVLGHKIRLEYMEFMAPQPGWQPQRLVAPTIEADIFRSLDMCFRLLEMSLCAEQNRTKESEILDTEWRFFCDLLTTAHPIEGLDVYIAEGFCRLVMRRFEHLQEFFLEAIKGAIKLDKHLDTFKLRSRHAKHFFRLMIHHFLRACPLALGPHPGDSRRPEVLAAFVNHLLDLGYRLVAHTTESVFVFSRNPGINVFHFLCVLPCNPDVLVPSNAVVLVHYPDAPSFLRFSPLLTVRLSDMGIVKAAAAVAPVPVPVPDHAAGAAGAAPGDLPATAMHSTLMPSQMPSPVLLVAATADALPHFRAEFGQFVTGQWVMSQSRRLQVAMNTLEATLNKYTFTLLNGIELIKEHYEDVIVETLFTYAFDFAQRSSRLVTNPRRLHHRLLLFTIDWIRFTCTSYSEYQQGQPSRKTFRWALIALESTLSICRSGTCAADGSAARGHGVLSLLTDREFAAMRVQVGHCMSLLISHFESFSPQLTLSGPTQPHPHARFFEGTGAKLQALEDRRVDGLREARLIGRVLDSAVSERSLASLSSSASSISIRWQHGRFLGGGTYGSVYMGIDLTSGELLAVKEIRIQDTANFATLKQMVADEMQVMEQLSHPNVVQYYGIEVHRDKVYLFMEYVPNGTLSSIVDVGGLDERIIQRVTYQILLGLQYLHSKRIVHRDIKPDNILLDQNGNIKLVDFGAAKMLSNQKTMAAGQSAMSLIGTPNYLAPEVIIGSPGGRIGCQDIWSLGCVLYELYTGRAPWSHLDNQWAIIYHCAVSPPPIPDNIKASPLGLEFLKLCLQVNPHNRPTAADLLVHPFVAGIAKEAQVCPPTMQRLISTLHTTTTDEGDAAAAAAAGSAGPRSLAPPAEPTISEE